jgi:hypothetical protein
MKLFQRATASSERLSRVLPEEKFRGLWKTMGKSLAEACGRHQGQLSCACPSGPSTAWRTVREFRPQPVECGEGRGDSAQLRGSREVKLFAKIVRSHKPRFALCYSHQQTLRI